MARRPVSIGQWAGLGAAVLVAVLSLGTLVAVAGRAEDFSSLSRHDWASVRFTVVQAALSAALSVAISIPVARALARRSFVGRGVLVTLLGAPFILPVIVAILGLTAVFGKSGIVSNLLIWAGLEPISIYGFHGVIIAHVFFNIPLATRLLLHGWGTIPSERFRLAASLRFTSIDVFRHVEIPMLRDIVPGALAVIFLICTTSFAVALTFGGGPKATTIELAIYEAFRYDFDLGKASLLALIQFAICTCAALFSFKYRVPHMVGGGLDRPVARLDTARPILRLIDTVWIVLAALFLLAPLAALVVDGAGGVLQLPVSVWYAAARSVLTALGSAALAIVLSLALVLAGQRWHWIEGVGMLSIAASPLVMGTGLFIMIFPFFDPATLALVITALVNAVMSLPFVIRAIAPAIAGSEAAYGKLADGLGMSGWTRLRLVTLPRIRAPLGFAAGLSAALSMGDLGVITLFARPEQATLPLQIYRLMGAYRMDQAMGAALLLLALSLGLFYIFDRGGRGRAHT
ncbi:thiamine/thiamine pyrophosphate ABC transporter permease ThiP [Celeribacter marinus]|uniref:Thiamin ABC transporter, transmembrane component n=1 Tax=Celeribacter marinus TaxID=1397108 RepID=A0A0P0ACG4_9RHOB|nr:thiamine/thiamine pyrophosphate ABC transporter permease ThiP [Celeribacter marinus]ALI55808.1 thiamin ABC transporter, transmembrane component [Celeribacter marinus]SFK90988.1 thiamine transport system permease protein [Celeribacter marinus]